MDTADGAVLLVAADRRELEGLRSRCSAWEVLNLDLRLAVRATLGRQYLLLAADGPGPQLAARAVRQACAAGRIRAIVSTGTCGALDPALQPGDIFVATEVTCPDTAAAFPARIPATRKPHRRGVLVSVNRIVPTATEKAALSRFGQAVEMEAAAVAAEAHDSGLPFYAVRVVLDGAGESFRLDYNALRGADGRFSPARLLLVSLRRPHAALPELVRLRRRLRWTSEILGEFLAGCEF